MKFRDWHGGQCFGPRLWTDALPILAVPLGVGLEWAARRCRPVFVVFATAILWSIGVQLVGAACYPSTWGTKPDWIELRKERLWDWRDSELTRCLAEGPNDRLRRLFPFVWKGKKPGGEFESGEPDHRLE